MNAPPSIPTERLQIDLGWPAKALSPNHRSRSHWPRTRALAAAKEEGQWATLAALRGRKFEHGGGRLSFAVTAYPPTRHARDDDNLAASLKGHRDGIAKALGVDDSLFDQQPIQWGEPQKGGAVIVEIAA